MLKPQPPTGSRTFMLIWFGQFVSLIGSGLTGFALGVWVYQRTGSTTKFALITLFATLPGILVSPLAGVLVDRWDRRLGMLLSDSVAALCTLLLVLLLVSGQLEIWHIYLATGVTSLFLALHWPAYSAAVTMLIPKTQWARANGLIQFSQATARIVSPMVAGGLVAVMNLHGVLLADLATFLFAVATLLLVRIPHPPPVVATQQDQPSLLQRVFAGWRYIAERPGLRQLLTLFAVNNFLTSLVVVLVTPLVLSFASPSVLGVVLGIAGSGMLAGSAALSAWGGPRHRVRGILILSTIQAALLVAGGLRQSSILIAVAAFGYFFAASIMSGASQSLWQSKVDPAVQGRVFAMRSMIAWSAIPLAALTAGPLADEVFEPLLAAGGPLAASVGRIIGVGPGRGIGLLFITAGVITLLTTTIAWLQRRLRHVEDELPDVIVESKSEHGPEDTLEILI